MTTGSLPKPAGTRILWWLLPIAFLVIFYRDGLSTWFVADDFAWLSLLRLAIARHDLLHELFAPMAQGTIRPWSERGFFMVLESIVGLDALPFRLVVFATAAADVALIAWITLRATGSRVAGFIAPLLWTVNAALVRPMTWDSTFNEMLCPLFLLGALSLYILYLDTGQRKFWWWQVVVFSLGFGALETNIVYPALAAAWVLFIEPARNAPNPAPALQSRDRKGAVAQLTTILPQAAISALYFLLHRLAAPIPTAGPYTLFFDRSVLKTLALYWKWSLVPEPMERFGHSHLLAILAFVIVSLAIAAYAGTRTPKPPPYGAVLPVLVRHHSDSRPAPVQPSHGLLPDHPRHRSRHARRRRGRPVLEPAFCATRLHGDSPRHLPLRHDSGIPRPDPLVASPVARGAHAGARRHRRTPNAPRQGHPPRWSHNRFI